MRYLLFVCLLGTAARADLASGDAHGQHALLSRALFALKKSYGPPEVALDAPPPLTPVFLASPGTVRTALSYALLDGEKLVDDTLYFNRTTLARLDRAFRAAFGKPLVRRRVHGRTEYDADGLRAAFRAIYVKPDEPVGGVPARALYDPLRGFVAGAAEATAQLLDHPARLARAAREYDARGSFDYPFIERRFPELDVFDVITAGVVLRRQLDGTLPVLVEALRTVLADYDPQAFAELDRRLRMH
jgi:hypothetical protein